MQRIIWDRATDASPATKESVFNILIEREITRDHAERKTNPWLGFVSEFFAECRESGSMPWRNTGTSPMAFASQVYQERQTMQEAFTDNGMWGSEETEDRFLIDPEDLCEDDLSFWHDKMDQADQDAAQHERNRITFVEQMMPQPTLTQHANMRHAILKLGAA